MEDNRVLELDALTPSSLQKMIDGDILAIRIKNFCSDAVADKISHYISKSVNLEKYSHETYEGKEVVQNFYGVYRWGTPFNSTYGKSIDSAEKTKYYNEVGIMNNKIREICSPHKNPIDTLMNQFMASCEHGAKIADFEGKTMFSGIIRAMFPETAHLSETTPHVDCLPPSIKKLDHQFSANIYLKVPKEQGELIVWDTTELSQEEVTSLEGEELPKEILSNPLYLKPEKNELILINTRIPHAICGFDKGERISIQSFIGHESHKPFSFWC